MKIFDTRNPFAILIILVSMISVSAVIYAFSYQMHNAHTIEELDKYENIWKKAKPQNYRYSINDGCMFVRVSDVTVIFGNEHIKPPEEGSAERRGRVVISELFLTLRRALISAENVDVEYHQTYGYPKNIKIDWEKDVIDDECFYSVASFELLE